MWAWGAVDCTPNEENKSPRLVLAVLAVIRIKEIVLLFFAVLWILFFLSPFTLYSRNTRTPMTGTERAVMIVLGVALVVVLWYALPNS